MTSSSNHAHTRGRTDTQQAAGSSGHHHRRRTSHAPSRHNSAPPTPSPPPPYPGLSPPPFEQQQQQQPQTQYQYQPQYAAYQPQPQHTQTHASSSADPAPAYRPYDTTVHNHGPGVESRAPPSQRWCYFGVMCGRDAHTLALVTAGAGGAEREVCAGCLAAPPAGYLVVSLVGGDHRGVRHVEGGKRRRRHEKYR